MYSQNEDDDGLSTDRPRNVSPEVYQGRLQRARAAKPPAPPSGDAETVDLAGENNDKPPVPRTAATETAEEEAAAAEGEAADAEGEAADAEEARALAEMAQQEEPTTTAGMVKAMTKAGDGTNVLKESMITFKSARRRPRPPPPPPAAAAAGRRRRLAAAALLRSHALASLPTRSTART